MVKKLFLLFCLSMPLFAQFITPGTGVNWNLDSLKLYSGGVVTLDTGWYKVTSLVTVSANDKVVIDAGTKTVFASSTAGFAVNGTLKILGQDDNRVFFTALTKDSLGGSFQGFQFNDTSIDSACIIRYATINYAYYGFRCIDASPVFEYNELYKCRRGVQLSSANPKVVHNKISRSYEYGITMTLGSSPLIEWNEIFDNNTQNTSPKNQISIGTQGNNSPTIRYNKIYGGWSTKTGGISVSALFTGSSSASEIAYNEIFNNSYGIALAGGDITAKVHHNKIYNNNINPDPNTSGSGINVNGNSVNIPVIFANEITGNFWGVTIQNGTTIQAGPLPNLGNLSNTDSTDDGKNIIHSNMQGTTVYDLYNNTTLDIMAENNDWGVYDSLSIEDHIVHKKDNTLMGTVDFIPFINSVIPVELVDFSISNINDFTLIQWTTATETNCKEFIIESNSNGKNGHTWIFLERIRAAGNSTEVNKYTFKTLTQPQINSYRVRLVDFDGSSKVLFQLHSNGLITPNKHTLIGNYPNPFNPSTVLQFFVGGNENVDVTIKMTDITGKEVIPSIRSQFTPGLHNYSLNLALNNLGSGLYFVQLIIDRQSFVRKIMYLR